MIMLDEARKEVGTGRKVVVHRPSTDTLAEGVITKVGEYYISVLFDDVPGFGPQSHSPVDLDWA